MLRCLVVLGIVGSVWAQGDAFPEDDAALALEIEARWDGADPPGWDGWDETRREEYSARMEVARQAIALHVEENRAQRPDTPWGTEESFDLYRRSVNTGLEPEVAQDLAEEMVSQDVPVEDARAALRAAATESAMSDRRLARAAAASDDASRRVGDQKNLGQWVKEQVENGLRGQELADAIHAQVERRHEERMAEIEALKEWAKSHSDGHGNAPGSAGHDGSVDGADHGHGQGDGHGHWGGGDHDPGAPDHGQGGGHGQGGEHGHGGGHGPK